MSELYTKTLFDLKNPEVTVVLRGDANDADYVTDITYLSLEEFNETVADLKEILRLMSKYEYIGTMWQKSSEIDSEDLDRYDELIMKLDYIYKFPTTDQYENCHSIYLEEITLIETDGKIYKIELK